MHRSVRTEPEPPDYREINRQRAILIAAEAFGPDDSRTLALRRKEPLKRPEDAVNPGDLMKRFLK